MPENRLMLSTYRARKRPERYKTDDLIPCSHPVHTQGEHLRQPMLIAGALGQVEAELMSEELKAKERNSK